MPGSIKPPIQKLMDQGDLFFNENQFAKAERCYSKVIANLELEKLTPADDVLRECLIMRAQCRIQQDEFAEVIKDCEHILSFLKEDNEALFYNAVALAKFKKFDEAITIFSRLLEITCLSVPCYLPALYARADSYFQCGNYQAAISDFSTLIAIKNSKNQLDEALLKQRAYCFLASQDLTSALKDYDRIINYFNNFQKYHIEAYRFRADIHYQNQNYQQAANDYSVLIDSYVHQEQVPAELWRFRASCYHRLNQPELAIADFDQALRLNLSTEITLETLLLRGENLFKQNRFREALNDFTACHDLAASPQQKGKIWYKSALCQKELGLYYDALSSCEYAFQSWPHQFRPHYLAAVIYWKLGQSQAAENLCLHIMALLSDTNQQLMQNTCKFYCSILLQTAQYEKLLAYIKHLPENSYNTPDIVLYRARGYLGLNKVALARQDLTYLRIHHPDFIKGFLFISEYFLQNKGDNEIESRADLKGSLDAMHLKMTQAKERKSAKQIIDDLMTHPKIRARDLIQLGFLCLRHNLLPQVQKLLNILNKNVDFTGEMKNKSELAESFRILSDDFAQSRFAASAYPFRFFSDLCIVTEANAAQPEATTTTPSRQLS